MGVLAWVMISFAGLDGARMLAVVSAFPILFLIIALCFSAIKGCYAPKTDWMAALKKGGSDKKENA